MRISRRHRYRPQVKIEPKYKVNHLISAPRLRVIDESGKYLGEMSREEALKIAEERGFDLVEVNPAAQPPVAKILNYGQFKYEKEKELKKQKQLVKQIEVKGLRLSTRISAHDQELRRNQAKKFLEDGNKVKLEIILRGRERQHSDLAYKMIKEFITGLNNVIPVKVEAPATNQGGKVSALVAKA
jgi:translation initiation factor IF-3